ncbi:DUF6460 domain-containing protein [Devosia aurantiaca]|uniref:DUF6460 domain-containing protein n=1 Tax=Devosia aurantiaca TaxID=2714858 RepID=A0A6M1SJC9_9HYPH|nr:DUF6460 domain-containing protein [Devosia aurantiaca]NGP17230.1 hypothetical protein [Devosia aurantiaca]
MTEDYRPQTRSGAERLFGGRPSSVVMRLVLISLLVGFVMSVFGFNASDLLRGAVDAVREALRDGGGIVRQIIGYVLAGAAVVVPIWLLMRLARGGR